MIEFSTVDIEFLDGTTERVEWTTRQYVADGVLNLFKKNGDYVIEEHLGSWPLTAVKKWKKTRQ